MTLGQNVSSHMDGWLGRAIEECERQLRAIGFQLKVDQGYVESPEADPREIDYYRCQIELNLIERECRRKKLAILKQWALAQRQSEVGGKPAPPPRRTDRNAAD